MKILKKIALSACALSLGLGAYAAETDLLAFPGAEGFGRYTKGARAVANPEIYHVTNLNDAGPGSLRDAVSKGGRIVVFDVSGVIELKSTLIFKGNLTVLGQTAPGEGIQVYGNRVSFSNSHNTIVRYLRIRMGVKGDSGKDAAGVAEGHDMIFDHMSVLWGRDENFSISSNSKGTSPVNITIQNSIIGQGLQSHSCGGLIQTDGGVTLYRNLYIENKTRNPKVKGLNQYVNNVVYNWGDGGAYIMSDSEGDSWADIQNNYFMRGPWNGATKPFSRGKQGFRFFGAGNYFDDNKDGVLNGRLLTTEEMLGTQSDGSQSIYLESLDAVNAVIDEFNTANADKIAANTQVKVQHLTPIQNMMSAEEAYAWILENVGPTLPARDEVDQYLIDELASYGAKGTKNGITSEAQLPHKGTGILSGGVKPLDSDGDGIPDAWEIANGLNPNDPSDAVQFNAEGYTNIEAYSFTITEAYPYIKRPIKLAVTDQQKETLTLTWDINKNTKYGFEIETSTDGTNFTKAATAAAGEATATITGLTPRTKYWVRLRSVGADGLVSDYTDIVATETIGEPAAPAPSTNPFPAIGAKEGVANGITFTWVDDVKTYGGETTYAIYLGTSAENLEKKAEGLTKKEWACNELEAGKTYYWRVDATNSIGTTTGTVWNFTSTAGGVLFYTDFTTTPEEYATAYGDAISNTDIFKKGSKNDSKTFNGMVIGVGETASRIVHMPGCYSSDSSKDYGPASVDDEGATTNAIQFNTGNGYVTTPTVAGPCVITYWLGNTGTSQQTAKLVTIAGGDESTQDLVIGNKKRVFKFTVTYPNAGDVQFRLESNGKKFNVNDILVERYVAPEGEQTLELSAGKLINDVSFEDGSISLKFNQEVVYKGTATISGIHQYEDIAVSASGANLSIAYTGLDINSTYTVKFASGNLTNLTGTQSFIGEVQINTSDYARAVASGDKHFGKAIKNLPANFAPFNVVAPFETVGGNVQTANNDYPHWCQVGGGNDGTVAADYVAFCSASKNDKVMGYFEGPAKKIAVDLSAEEGTSVLFKVQESRNPDLAPAWRTIRVFTEKDLPFKGEFELNPESRFVKIVPASVSGTAKLNGLRISDANGFFGDDYVQSGIDDIIVDTDNNAPIYNLLGIQVDENYKGIVIKNGKKYIQR